MRLIIYSFLIFLALSVSAAEKSSYVLLDNGYIYCSEGAIVVEKTRSGTFPVANQVYVPQGWYYSPITYSTQSYAPSGEPVACKTYKAGKSKVYELRGWFYRITTFYSIDL